MLPSEIEHYCFEHTSAEPEYLQKLVQLSNEHMEYSKKISGRVIGRTLKLLVQLLKPKRLLEIGTFTGYSALSMAEGLETDAHIYCLESSPKAVDFSQKFLEQTPFKHQISLLQGHAIDTLLEIKAPLDFVFIDADKRNYANYYNLVFPKVRIGGLIVIDNVLWNGKVLNPENDADWGVVRLNKLISIDSRVENLLLGVRDGLHIARKVKDGPQPLV
jgi:caffeoyl-CoA O-methyltransferase